MTTAMTTARLTTAEYPVRHEAWKHPGTMLLAATPKATGGYEWAVLYTPMVNETFPHNSDGVFVEVTSYQNKFLLVDCHATAPTEGRPQINTTRKLAYTDFDKALAMAELWHENAVQWCQSSAF